MIGSPLFLAIAKLTCPDILYDVNILSRFIDKPTQAHMQEAKRISRYLDGTSELINVHRKQEDPVLLGESGADWSGDQNDQKSTAGFYFKYGQHSGAISWQMRKQQTVALSSCESEYQCLAAAAQEKLFFPQSICDLQHPTSLGEDNQRTFKLSTNPVLHKRSKHIDVKQHFLRDTVQKNDINILHLPT